MCLKYKKVILWEYTVENQNNMCAHMYIGPSNFFYEQIYNKPGCLDTAWLLRSNPAALQTFCFTQSVNQIEGYADL